MVLVQHILTMGIRSDKSMVQEASDSPRRPDTDTSDAFTTFMKEQYGQQWVNL